MIIQPWPPDGTIMGGAPAPPDDASNGGAASGAEQLVDELRTIATCVLGFTELLRGANLASDDRQVYLGVLHEQATRLARLVERLDRAEDGGGGAPAGLPG